MNNSKESWTCETCNEKVEEQFEVCWNCRHDRHGLLFESFSSADEEDRDARELVNNKWRDKNCVQCKTVLTYVGKKEFHEGLRWGALGDFWEIFVNNTKLEMYFCPTCHRVEFFLSQ